MQEQIAVIDTSEDKAQIAMARLSGVIARLQQLIDKQNNQIKLQAQIQQEVGAQLDVYIKNLATILKI